MLINITIKTILKLWNESQYYPDTLNTKVYIPDIAIIYNYAVGDITEEVFMATSSKSGGKKKSATKKKPIKSNKKTTTKPTKKSRSNKKVGLPDKQKMIQEAAYFIAQQRGFAPGNEIEDWLAAERKVNKLI